MADETLRDRINSKSFYSDTIDNFQDVLYAMTIAIENHFGDMLLKGELDRIIYSDNAYAFRKRAKDGDFNNIKLPFINYKLTDISFDNSRNLFNNVANVEGIYIPEIGNTMSIVPVNFEYEMTYWTNYDLDNRYASSLLLKDASNETIIYPTLNIGNETAPIPAFLDYNMNYDSEYDQNDWLTMNRIHNISINPSFQSMLVYGGNPEDIFITEETLLNFIACKDLGETDPELKACELMEIYFSDTCASELKESDPEKFTEIFE